MKLLRKPLLLVAYAIVLFSNLTKSTCIVYRVSSSKKPHPNPQPRTANKKNETLHTSITIQYQKKHLDPHSPSPISRPNVTNRLHLPPPPLMITISIHRPSKLPPPHALIQPHRPLVLDQRKQHRS